MTATKLTITNTDLNAVREYAEEAPELLPWPKVPVTIT